VLAAPAGALYAITHADRGDDSLVITPGVDLGQELRFDDPRHAGGKVVSPRLSLDFRMIGAMAERCIDPALIDEAAMKVLAATEPHPLACRHPVPVHSPDKAFNISMTEALSTCPT
jgi:hypothetical protein